MLILLITLNFIPTIVAACRSHRLGSVFVINLLLGWTIIGWVVALVMACGSKVPPAQSTVIIQQADDGTTRQITETRVPLKMKKHAGRGEPRGWVNAILPPPKRT